MQLYFYVFPEKFTTTILSILDVAWYAMWPHLFSRRSSSTRSRDSLVELTELVHKGEKKGLFTDKMPARIQQVVRDENLRFMKNRGVYDADYFSFLLRLTRSNVVSTVAGVIYCHSLSHEIQWCAIRMQSIFSLSLTNDIR